MRVHGHASAAKAHAEVLCGAQSTSYKGAKNQGTRGRSYNICKQQARASAKQKQKQSVQKK
jgi:hypothetical protein